MQCTAIFCLKPIICYKNKNNPNKKTSILASNNINIDASDKYSDILLYLFLKKSDNATSVTYISVGIS